MNNPKIQLTDDVQELIAEMQANNSEQAKSIIGKLDSWITTILTGNTICGGSAEETLKLLGDLNSMRLDYMAFLVNNKSNQ